mmetsp:Transcript_19392/g.40899  ORF Transcript_19392/g.40899 Transcript_19392/m.40899 type:complete len:585 (-) Transcript_19392:230-1984(-)|eukprot:CAMPEP_0183735074 /NCGR_PEP_ID=MMETSP0737-20130205/45585_1 /TAXON_ID=385413 /ORGANISM="Thalassiosira miniscula, Strain CCMP1093" /LENGTH=584 /DNA_ID=CAMNT_0025968723 /DNA_START=220 /DNA_END=1974 /DNA_ORIENTATION=+
MSVSFAAKLTIFIVALAGSLMIILYRVHTATQYSFDLTTGLGNLPAENGVPNNKDPSTMLHKKTNRVRRMAKERKEKEAKAAEKEEEAKEKKPMNIILFYADDWRHDTLGAAGNPVVKTPVLDALAKEGVRFTENCVTTSICWVSRATLYSGQYLARHHFEMLGRGRTIVHPNGTREEMGFEVPMNETVYALLKKAGYAVGHAGKLGIWRELDRNLNFDFMVDEDGWHWRQIGDRMWHITEKNTADALRFLMTRGKKKPFFLNVAYFATHAVDGDKRQYLPQNASMHMYANDTIPIPETATDEAWNKMPPFFGDYNEGRTRWRWRFDKPDKHQSMMKNYYRMATEVDTSVGILLKHIEQQGELDNTLIIFTTDNGNFHAEHGLADKWYPHQESIRVPLIIKDPRMSPEFVGTTNDEFTLNIDLTTTILGAAGLDPLPSMMGRDMSVLYRDSGLKDASAATAQSRRQASSSSTEKRHHPFPASDGYGKYHSGSEHSWRTEFFYEHPMHSNPNYIPASEALVRKDYKYFYWPNFKYEQLFDLKNDPGELNDLFNSEDPVHQQKLKEMRKRFVELKMMAHSDLSIIL